MKEKDKINSMHFGADAFTFQKAEELRISSTDAEKVLWQELRNKKLDGLKFRRQHPIGRFIVDFYCHSLKLVVEIDGSIHNEARVMENDKNRQEEIEELGLKVIRFKNKDVILRMTQVVNEIGKIAKTLTIELQNEK